MNSHWNYKDSLDLEFFILQDTDHPDGQLHERDRQLYLEKIEPHLKKESESSPVCLLSKWVKLRRATVGTDTRLPGDIAGEVYGLTKLVLILFGFTTGGTAGFLYLSYTGETPVNVLPFLAIFVLSQLGLALLVLLRHSIGRLISRSFPSSILLRTLSTLTIEGYRRLVRKTRHTMSADSYHALLAAVGRGRGFQTIHERVFYWPLFLALQLAGICFNIGLLGASLLKVTVSDIAFGWQSTLQISASGLHSFTKWMAVPWSWFMEEGAGYPTLADIEGSRIVLKEGISHLMTENLISWWPFLLMSLFTYGLLVRVLFYLFGKHKERTVSARFEVTTPAVNQIIRRMQAPLVTTQAQPEQATEETEKVPPAPTVRQDTEEVSLLPAAVLIPDECFETCQTGELSTLLAREGYTIGSVHRFQVDYRADQELLLRLQESSHKDAAVIILMEAWMPPLVGFLSYLQSMRKETGARLPIVVRLLGKPVGNSALTPVEDPLHIQVWKNKIDSLGDPYLTISPLISQDRT